MLTLITGRGKSGKTRLLLEQVKRCPSTAMASRIILVPEQLSHETERLLSRLCGDEISYVSEVLSFTRLFSRVSSLCGGGAIPMLDQGGRLLSARLALSSIRPQLRVFASAAGKAEFLTGVVSLLDELKAYAVTPRQLDAAAQETTGLFSQKLRELGWIASAYDAVTAQGAADPQDQLTLLKNKLSDGNYGANRHFFVDGFTDFSQQELMVLDALLRTGQSMTVTIPCGDPSFPEELFAPALETFAKLKAMGEAAGQEVRVVYSNYQRPLPDALTYLDRLFVNDTTPFPTQNDAVSVLSFPDRLEECQACGAVIKRYAMAGLRYRDMAIAVSDEKDYGPLLRSVFSSMDIPLYISEKRQVLANPAARAVVLALECVINGMEQEDVIAYLKTGLTGLSSDGIDRLENYAVIWGLRGTHWEETFTMHPEGYDGRFTEETETQLAQLNQEKNAALAPLFRLSKRLKASHIVSDQLTAIYDFMEDAKLLAHLETAVSTMTAQGRLEEAQETAQIWTLLLLFLGQMYSVLGSISMSGEEFLRVFQLALSQYEVGTIPAALDAVSFGSIASMRGKEPKILCVLGANEGLMPASPSGGSLLTEAERAILKQDFSIELAPDSEGSIQRELLMLYSAFTAPTQNLYVFYPTSNQSEAMEPSFLVKRLLMLYPGCAALPPADTGYTPESAAEQCLSTENDALRAVLLQAAGQVPDMETILRMGQEGARPRDMLVSPAAAKALFGTPVMLTASRLDKLGSCPLEFFLYYGLKARARKEASFDAAEFGTFIHFILEHAVPSVIGRPDALNAADSMALVNAQMEPYRAQRLSAIPQTSRQTYLLSRNRQEAALLVQEISDELSRSDFVPCAYELRFGTEDLPALTAEGTLGEGSLSGFVDRADLWTGPEDDFFRIIDYKTGTKKFDYTDLYGGVGMQMLLYLFALEQSGIPGRSKSPTPAGVLYFPASRKFLPQDGPSETDAVPTRRSGLVLGEEMVLSAMEHGEQSQYIPNKKEYRISRAEMQLLKTFVNQKLADATDRILGGRFAPKPFYRGVNHDPCEYCDFGAICQKDRQFRKSCYQKPISPEAFWDALKEGNNNG